MPNTDLRPLAFRLRFPGHVRLDSWARLATVDRSVSVVEQKWGLRMFRRNWLGAGLITMAVAMVFAFPVVASAAYTNTDCTVCHASTLGAVPAQNFNVGTVDFDTACKKCHDESLVGSHPYHNPTSNCGASCHAGWGAALVTAVPMNLDPRGYGSFASSSSADMDPALLHLIHSKPRWMESMKFPSSTCGSCHAVATCDSCHDNPPAPDTATHANHASTLNLTPWVGNTSSGVTAGDQTENTYRVGNSNTCGAIGCHDTAGIASSAPGLLDDKSHAPDAERGFLANTVTKVGVWKIMYANIYTMGQTSQSNALGATLSVPFTGQQIVMFADKDPYRGKAEILIDGVSKGIVDLYQDTTMNQAEIFRSAILPAGAHTITVRVTNTKNPLARATYVRVDQFKVYNRVPGDVAPACTTCHPGNAGSHGMGLFSHVATGTAAGLLSGSRCDSCHEMAFIGEHNRLTSASAGGGCATCHTAYAPTTLTGTWVGTDGCNYVACHKTATPRQPHTAMTTAHAVTTAPAEAVCRGCHTGNLGTIHSNSITTNAFVTNCNTCHSPSTMPTTKSCIDAACHAGSGVTALDDHAFNTVKHTSTPWTSVYQGSSPSVSTGGKECSTCHSARLDTAHATTSRGAISCSSGGTGSTGCHNNTSLTSQAVAIGNYSQKRCTQCHNSGANVSHENTMTPHMVAPGTCAGTMTGCHTSTDLWLLHSKSQSGGAPTGASCANLGCHSASNLNKRPTLKTCGTGNACHASKDLVTHPGSHNHGYTSASDYNAGTGTGCSNSGQGCHGTDATRTDMVSPYHAGSGCMGSACHTSASKPGYGGSNECVSCHNSNYTGAPDRVALTGTYPNGHYNETTHTATGMGGLIDGGAYLHGATCAACHSSELRSAHSTDTLVLDSGRPAWTTPYCVNCHNAATVEADSVQTIKADNWSARTCDQCHTTNGNGKHGAYTPVSHTATTGTNGCGCHDTKDVRAIHDTVNATAGCTASGPDSKGFANPGCHSLDKPMDLTPMACGSAEIGCHRLHNDWNHGAAHTLTPSPYDNVTVTGCTGAGDGCHGEADDLNYTSTEYHPIDGDPNNPLGCTASICHNSPDRTQFSITDSISCLQCHSGNYAGGVAVSNLMALGTNGGHYVQAPHQSTNGSNTLNAGGTASATCNDCHSADRALTGLFSQHQAINATVTPGSVTNSFVDGFESGSYSAWTTADYQPASSGSVTYINEGFESGTFTANAWTATTGAAANATVEKHAGTYASSLRAGYASTTPIRYTKTFNLSTATGNSTLSFWYRIPTAMNTGDVLRVGWSTDGTNYTYGLNRTSPGTTAWTQVQMTNVPYTSNVTIKFELVPRSSTTRNYIYIDDITLTNTAAAAAEAGWKVQNTTKSAGTYGAKAIGGGGTTRYLTKTGIVNTGADQVHVDYSLNYASLEAADSLTVQTYDGTAWTTRRTYNLVTTPNLAWSNESITGLPANTQGVRFAFKGDTADDLVYVDDVSVHKVVDDIVVGGITLTCYDCHNKNTATVNLTKSALLGGTVWDGGCTACHTGIGGIAAASHLTTIPVATGTSTQGCASGGAGCHGSNLHVTHKGNGVGSDPSCSACHLYTAQGASPVSFTCGQGGACHTSHTATTHGTIDGNDVSHTAISMATKVDGTTYDIGGGNVCTSCHSAGLKTSHTTKAGWTTPYCLNCHNSTTPVNSVTTIKTNSWSAQTCDQCHVTNGPGKHNTYTVASHRATASGCTLATGCHGWASGGQTLDVRAVHNRVFTNAGTTPGCTATGNDSKGTVPACHALNKDMSGALTCGDTGTCHAAHTAANHGPDHNANQPAGTLKNGITYTYGNNAGCFMAGANTGCHFQDLRREHGTTAYLTAQGVAGTQRTMEGARGGSADGCTVCHATGQGTAGAYASRTAIVNTITNNDYRCTSCHFETTDAAGTTGVRRPHTATERVANAPLGTTQEWAVAAAQGGGHNSYGVQFPRTTGFGSVNGQTPGTLAMSGSYVSGWTNASVVTCTSVGCHNRTTAPNGPQGASVPWYWNNQASPAGTITSHWYTAVVAGTTTPAATGCANCHQTLSSTVHGRGDHYRACQNCHVRIPHAWKRPRLLRRTIAAGGTTTQTPDALPYADPATGSALEAYTVTGGQTNFSSGNSCNDNCGEHNGATPYWP